MLNYGRNKFVVACAALAFLFASDALASEAVTVEAMGQAPVYNKDVSQARDKAIDDAKRKAVEQAIGSMVSSETVTENFQLISDKILSKSSGYVRRYKILSEGATDEGIYQVKMEAMVQSGVLNSDLQGVLAILQAKKMPRVLVMITEQNIGGAPSAWWTNPGASVSMDVAENTLIDEWRPKGVKFVERQVLDGKIRVGAVATTDLQNDVAKEFGAMSGAEIVVIGKAIATKSTTIPLKTSVPMYSVNAQISVRVLNVDDGSILATATLAGAGAHINEVTAGHMALKNVAKKASEELLTKILTTWQSEISGPATISLRLTGVNKSKFLRQIATFLRNQVRGIGEVRQRSFKAKAANLEIEMKGTSQDLAEELEEKGFPKFNIEISEITANRVVAKLIPKK